MPLGGGTFKEMNKIIPGVYINIDYQKESLDGVTSGVVGCVVITTKVVENPVLADRTNYITKLRQFFDDKENENKVYQEYCVYVSEILLHAIYVHLIPYHTDANHKTDADNNTIEKLLWKIDMNVLVALDYYQNSFVKTNDSDIPLIGGLGNVLKNSSSRFPVLIGGNMLKENLKTALKDLEVDVAKWIQVPYCKVGSNNIHQYDSVFFLAGVLSTLMEGQSMASVPYTGSLDPTLWIPDSYAEQEASINNGQLSFYQLGNLTTPYLLKDITILNWKDQKHYEESGYNVKSGPVVRIERYLYHFFTQLFQTTISGKPNSSMQRAIIKARIYEELHRLDSIGVINGYQQGDVTVDPVGGEENRDKIQVTIKYKPNYGIDYVYINVVVN